ncbi:hypothetical protein [Nitratireductor basaltis]|uniref:Bacterial transcription activator, effector binding domain n=1 Tax=Nitratireductor basaltis TaxID=472175 RepID=A0A084UB41_9HYPH|nr:hypothetical protein [Nitratireductor basaltis]KFB10177.1 Bacterial transcription activator, effector binding domain [Nitratireductor basaltis]
MNFELTERDAQTLFGMIWQGSHEEAARGEVKKVISLMEALRQKAVAAVGEDGGEYEHSGLIGISRNDRPYGFRYLVALPAALAAHVSHEDMRGHDFPRMSFATAWHGAEDGDVFSHYQSMSDWIEAQGLQWARRVLHHREEYTAPAILQGAPVLRLMMPVEKS